MTQEDYSKLLDDMTNAAIAGDNVEYFRLESLLLAYNSSARAMMAKVDGE